MAAFSLKTFRLFKRLWSLFHEFFIYRWYICLLVFHQMKFQSCWLHISFYFLGTTMIPELFRFKSEQKIQWKINDYSNYNWRFLIFTQNMYFTLGILLNQCCCQIIVPKWTYMRITFLCVLKSLICEHCWLSCPRIT